MREPPEDGSVLEPLTAITWGMPRSSLAIGMTLVWRGWLCSCFASSILPYHQSLHNTPSSRS
ncbi:hypothetical protein, partial [uncultured Imperialibacter sp.]|uniref:hypothetical protein n=1 Tax=uncultured Imperialibacter sp. TaxID=1672639 RepID=UPI0030DC95AE